MKQPNKIAIIGYFALGVKKFGGQSVKTLMFVRALRQYYSRKALCCVPTDKWKKHPLKRILQTIYVLRMCQSIIIFPAQNSVQILAPLLVFANLLFCRKLYYVVVGGWLPEMTKQKKWLAYFLKKFNGIYVETSSMKTALEKQGFTNIFIMPNFKNLPILTEKELIYTTKEPFAFCTFSRVMKEKGIEDAINAITQINTKAGHVVATLDIYGKVDDNYAVQFEKLQRTFPPYIKYKGIVPPNKSVDVLKHYFALLFPTHFETEGIPGTIIDSYAAGVPVITALWINYRDVFIENQTGYGFKMGDVKQLSTAIKNAIQNPTLFNTMKPFCLQEAQKYIPQKGIVSILRSLTI